MRSQLLGPLELSDAGALHLRDPFSAASPTFSLTISEDQSAEAGEWWLAVRDGKGARLEKRIARAGSSPAHLWGLAAELGLNPVFPDDVLREVEAHVADLGLDDPALRDDRGLAYVTIDGASSRDLDQAVQVTREGEGFLVRYALADAAHYVRPGSALWDEALRRGASFYFPGFMIPMLPRALSEGIVSLNPDVERRAMVFEMHVDGRGLCTRTEVVRARIRSRGKLSFERVQAFYDARPLGQRGEADAADGFEDAAVEETLLLLREVGLLRMRDAARRDVVRYRRTELSLGASEDGLRTKVNLDPRQDVERYNEQCSLLCNVEGARLLLGGADDAGVQPIYRVHPSPDPEKVDRFEAFLSAMVRVHDLDPERFGWRAAGEVALADFLSALPTEGAQGRVAQAIHRQAVMINLRSSFQDAPAGHHGVGAPVYARFSAPMREIVGVFLHKELWELLEGSASSESVRQRDEALREVIIGRANEAKRVQSRVSQLAHLHVLQQLFEEAGDAELAATLMGATRSKVHLTLVDPPVDVKLYTRDLEAQLGGEVQVGDAGASLRHDGEIIARVGERVGIRVKRWDDERRRYVLELETGRAG